MAITKPYTFVAGTKAKAVEVNTNFDKIYEEAGKLDDAILRVQTDVQDIEISKADINGNATQRFQLANPVQSYDGVNKNYLENSIANIKDYISGYVITKDTDNSIIVSAGSCYDSTFTTIMNSTGNITKENQTQSPNTTYYVYVISDNDGYNVDILIAEESVTPPRPEGYNLFRQIGSYTTDSDSKISIIKSYGNNYNVPSATATIVSTYVNGTSGYEIYSNGKCLQWGRRQTNSRNVYPVTYLLPYKNDAVNIFTQTIYNNLDDYNNVINVNQITSTGFNMYQGFAGSQTYIQWHSIGYI